MDPTLLARGINCVAVMKSVCLAAGTTKQSTAEDVAGSAADRLRDLQRFGAELVRESEYLSCRIERVKELHVKQAKALKEECNRLGAQDKELRATVLSLQVRLDSQMAAQLQEEERLSVAQAAEERHHKTEAKAMHSRQRGATVLGALVGGRSGLGGAIAGAAIGHAVGHALNVHHQHQHHHHGDHHHGDHHHKDHRHSVHQCQEQCEKACKAVSSLRHEIKRLQDHINLLSSDIKAKVELCASADAVSHRLNDLISLYSSLAVMAGSLTLASSERQDYIAILQRCVSQSQEKVNLPHLTSHGAGVTLMGAWEMVEHRCAHQGTEIGLIVPFVCGNCTRSVTEFPHVGGDARKQLMCGHCHSLTAH